MRSNVPWACPHIAASVGVGLLLMAGGCGHVREVAGEEIRQADINAVESSTGLTFPEACKWMAISHDKRSIDPSVYARINVPESQRTAVVAYIQSLTGHNAIVAGAAPVNWWPEESARPLVVKVIESGQGTCVVSVYEEEEGVGVYLSWTHY